MTKGNPDKSHDLAKIQRPKQTRAMKKIEVPSGVLAELQQLLIRGIALTIAKKIFKTGWISLRDTQQQEKLIDGVIEDFDLESTVKTLLGVELKEVE